MENSDNRSVAVHRKGSGIHKDGVRHIFVDRETGVNCLVWRSDCAGGITPLPDAEGKAAVTGV